MLHDTRAPHTTTVQSNAHLMCVTMPPALRDTRQHRAQHASPERRGPTRRAQSRTHACTRRTLPLRLYRPRKALPCARARIVRDAWHAATLHARALATLVTNKPSPPLECPSYYTAPQAAAAIVVFVTSRVAADARLAALLARPTPGNGGGGGGRRFPSGTPLSDGGHAVVHVLHVLIDHRGRRDEIPIRDGRGGVRLGERVRLRNL